MDIKKALQTLENNGYKHTGKRELLLEIFCSEKRYITAKEILQYMQEKYPKLSFDTVYRNLNIFADLKIIEVTEFSGEKKFRIRCTNVVHHHHIICVDCGKTEQIELCPMQQLDVSANFLIIGHKFEVYGHCNSCI